MPVDVAMPAAFHAENFLGVGLNPGCSGSSTPSVSTVERFSPETMAGNMVLLSPNGRRQNVQVKIYRTSLEHFAVIYPQKKVCKPLGVINLRNTSVERFPDDKTPGLVVRQRGFDNTASLSFISEEPRDVEAWVVAFTSRASPTILQSCLPVVQEDDEN